MLKQKLKYFISGFVVSTLLLSTMTVFGENIEKTISVVYNGAKVFVNGNLVDLKDGAGNKVEPFVFNGTTYLPVRAVSEALKQNVEWDGKNNSIWIGQRQDTGTPNIWLYKLNYLNEQKYEKNLVSSWIDWNAETDKDNLGNTYKNGFKIKLQGNYNIALKQDYYPWVYREYAINQKYKTFKGTFVLHNDSKNTDNHTLLKIYGDDQLLYTSNSVSSGKAEVDFSIDISSVAKLKIQVEGGALKSPDTVGIVNVGLYEK